MMLTDVSAPPLPPFHPAASPATARLPRAPDCRAGAVGGTAVGRGARWHGSAVVSGAALQRPHRHAAGQPRFSRAMPIAEGRRRGSEKRARTVVAFRAGRRYRSCAVGHAGRLNGGGSSNTMINYNNIPLLSRRSQHPRGLSGQRSRPHGVR